MSYVGTNLPYHQQDGVDYCAPAVAQMLLASLGAGLLSQDQLDAQSLRLSAPPFNGPEALCEVVSRAKPAACELAFSVCYDADRSAGCLRIARALLVTGVAVPAVIWGAEHWVAVSGAMLGGGRAPGAPWQLKGFFVNDPLPPSPSRIGADPGAPPPHAPGDGCGTGDRRGSADAYVTAYGWQHLCWGTPYRASPPAFATIVSAPAEAAAAVAPGTLASDPGQTVGGDDDVRRIVELGIARHGLATEGPLACLLAGARAAAVIADMPAIRWVDLERDGMVVGHAAVDPVGGQLVSVAAPSSRTAQTTSAHYRAACALLARR